MRRRTRKGTFVLASVVAFASTASTALPVVGRLAGPTAAAISTGAWTTDTPSGFKRQEVTYVTVDLGYTSPEADRRVNRSSTP